jgi:hypothetical protein
MRDENSQGTYLNLLSLGDKHCTATVRIHIADVFEEI